jgi:GR25 family glycosyltransferase involved in LPS biosynthesis
MKILFGVFLVAIILVAIWVSLYRKEGFDSSRASINSHIDAIYYINLEKRTDRDKEFLDNFSDVDQSRIHRVKAHYYPENGAVGCLMSHITALSLADKSHEGENILICEDDFLIKDMAYCNKMLDLFFKNIPEWDVVMLGRNTVESKDTGIETPEHEKIVKIINSQTTSGYIIKRNYIPKLLEIYGGDLTQYMQTGEWGNYFTDQSWKVLQPVDNWYSFEPAVGVQRPSYSDIQNGHIDVEV